MNYLGALLIISCAYYLGCSASKKESERLEAVEALISLFSYMQRRILAERLPLKRIFNEYTNGYLEKIGFLEALRSGRIDVNGRWQSALSVLSINGEARNELIKFGEGLGSLPLDTQLKRIDVCLSALNEARSRLQTELPKKRKSIKTVYLLIGLTVSIILL